MKHDHQIQKIVVIFFDKISHFNGGSSEEQDKQGGRFSIFAPNIIEEARFQGGGFSAVYGGKLASFLDIKIKEGNRQTPASTSPVGKSITTQQ